MLILDLKALTPCFKLQSYFIGQPVRTLAMYWLMKENHWHILAMYNSTNSLSICYLEVAQTPTNSLSAIS